MNYILKFIIIFLINSSVFATVLGGTVIFDNRDPSFNLGNHKFSVIDNSGTFGSVIISSTGNFLFPNSVTDNRPHPYSISIQQDD